MIRSLFRLRRGLLFLVAVGAFAPSLFARNQKVSHFTKTNVNVFSQQSTFRSVVHPGDAVSLNPQPLPPKVFQSTSNFGDAVSLNPQPLPPRLGTMKFFGH
jgi:hypothetical protein